jgi:molybdate transport system ATP-binding protein
MSDPFEIRLRLRLPEFELHLEESWNARAVAIFGPSGSGKTSTLEILAGIRRAEETFVRLDSVLLEDSGQGLRLPPERRRIGWVPQDASLFPHLDVGENLRFGAGRLAERSARAERKTAIDRAVEVLEIGHLLKRRPSELSGGERQRVALARALASGPRLLLLDEPFASLDLQLRARIFPYLIRLRDLLGLPMIYVTHDAGEALALAHRVLILEKGQVAASGEAEDLLRSPAALRLLDMVGLENRLVIDEIAPAEQGDLVLVRTKAGLTLTAPERFAALPGEVIGVRAEDILIATGSIDRLSAQNLIRGTIHKMSDQAGRCLVTVQTEGGELRAAITQHAAAELQLAEGRGVTLIFKAAAIHRLGEAGQTHDLGS